MSAEIHSGLKWFQESTPDNTWCLQPKMLQIVMESSYFSLFRLIVWIFEYSTYHIPLLTFFRRVFFSQYWKFRDLYSIILEKYHLGRKFGIIGQFHLQNLFFAKNYHLGSFRTPFMIVSMCQIHYKAFLEFWKCFEVQQVINIYSKM